MGAEATSLPPSNGSPQIVINNYVGKPEDKKKDKKEKSILPSPGKLTYTACELGLIHYGVFLTGFLKNDPRYQPAYVTGLVAGSIFGLYKAMTTGEQAGLMLRAEAFSKGDLPAKAHWVVSAITKGPIATIMLQNTPGTNSLGNIPALYWGFSMGSDISLYLCNSLFKKIDKKGD